MTDSWRDHIHVRFVRLLALTTLMSCSFGMIQAGEQPWQPPKTLDGLPVIEHLPALMQFSNGRNVSSASEWPARRREMQAMIQYYEYGHIPPRPDTVTVENLVTRQLPDVDVVEERMTLVIGSQRRLKMRIAVYRSQGVEKAPVIVREEHELGHIEEMPAIVRRGYLFVEYAREDLDPDLPNTTGAAQSAYPNYDWGTIAVWAWGAMRVVDYLESRDDVVDSKIGIVGHSRGGKTALLAGALDERFTLVAPNGSGSGGAGCFRIQPDGVETLELITRPERFGYWFHPRLRHFVDQENRLPIDQHFLKALVAPRALLCTDALEDTWANPVGNKATSAAAATAFKLLKAKDRNGLHFREGGHDLQPEDWAAILDFADWQFHGQKPANTARFFQFGPPR